MPLGAQGAVERVHLRHHIAEHIGLVAFAAGRHGLADIQRRARRNHHGDYNGKDINGQIVFFNHQQRGQHHGRHDLNGIDGDGIKRVLVDIHRGLTDFHLLSSLSRSRASSRFSARCTCICVISSARAVSR